MPKKKDLNDRQIQDYYEALDLAKETLIDGIFKLKGRRRKANSPGEEAEIDAKILDLSADKALLDAKRAAFKANRHAITPPTEDQLDHLGKLIEEVEELNANTQIAQEVIALSTDALNTFKTIHADQA